MGMRLILNEYFQELSKLKEDNKELKKSKDKKKKVQPRWYNKNPVLPSLEQEAATQWETKNKRRELREYNS